MSVKKSPTHKGKSTKVEPFTKKTDINLIRHYLHDRPFDRALFEIGINTNLRASDIIRLKVCDVKDMKIPKDKDHMPQIEIIEKKTKKPRTVVFNVAAVTAIQQLLLSDRGGKNSHVFLFTTIHGNMMSVPAFIKKIKEWTTACNIKGQFGTHSLRKTFGYWRRKAGVDIPTLMVVFNHKTQEETLNYLCIQRSEIKDVYWMTI